MGYRSEVAYVIEPVHIKPKEFLTDFLKEHKGVRKYLFSLGSLTVTDTQIRFKADWVKWYAGHEGVGGYHEVNAHVALVQWAEDRAEDAHYANQGAFGRVGENIDDNEVDWWGDEGYELISIRVELVVAPLEEVSE